MNNDEWTRFTLSLMWNDLIEIKKDVKSLRAFKFKAVGAIAVICVLATIAVDLIGFWIKK